MNNEVKTYHCPNCGADLKFSPETQKFACEYCKGAFTEEELLQFWNKMGGYAEEPVEDASAVDTQPTTSATQQEQEEFNESTQLYSCPSCGAEIICEANTAAAFCYYCHNPVILKGRVDGQYRPSKVIPFAFNKDKATSIFNDWAKKKFFRPKDLLSNKQMEKLTGLYVPFWVADADTSTHFTAVGVKVRTWSSGNRDYTEKKRYSVVRDLDVQYTGVPADGSQKIEDQLMEAIEPFHYTDAKDFNMAYLSGFYADKYDVEKESLFPRIKQRMTANNASLAKGSASYTSFENIQQWDKINDWHWDYMLMPVWFMSFEYKGKIWEYAINGQTGKIAGQFPIAKGKLRTLGLAIGAAIVAVIMLGGYLLA